MYTIDLRGRQSQSMPTTFSPANEMMKAKSNKPVMINKTVFNS